MQAVVEKLSENVSVLLHPVVPDLSWLQILVNL
jgi:hypothetical protein